jgi:hypothetical protein
MFDSAGFRPVASPFSFNSSMPTQARDMRVLLLILLLVCAPFALARDRSSLLEGTWVMNQELTEEVQPEFKNSGLFDNLGGGRMQVSVMGMPVPTSEAQPRPTIGTPRDPDVLACLEMILHDRGEKFLATYQNVGEEEFIRGDFRGRESGWNHRTLTQFYKTTERKVTKTYEIRGDGRLLVTVEIKPKKDKKRIFKRVFDRATGETKPNTSPNPS